MLKVETELLLTHGIKLTQIAGIKHTLGPVQMVTLLFGQYVFIAKTVNGTNYSYFNIVQTAVQ
jgi:hypothetical protein